MNLSGFVTINGTRVSVNWTIDGNTIMDGPGLSSSEIIVTGNEISLEEVVEVVYTDGYPDKPVTELRNLLSQRGEPIYGNKEQLLLRLRTWDENNPVELEALDPTAIIGEESSTALKEEVGDELNDGIESE
tara:strand:+ start:1371 stop:1763 length:393 start_codon:yes stop_codon:yes gene_type:complete